MPPVENTADTRDLDTVQEYRSGISKVIDVGCQETSVIPAQPIPESFAGLSTAQNSRSRSQFPHVPTTLMITPNHNGKYGRLLCS